MKRTKLWYLGYAACAALASRAYRPFDAAFSARLLESAVRAVSTGVGGVTLSDAPEEAGASGDDAGTQRIDAMSYVL